MVNLLTVEGKQLITAHSGGQDTNEQVQEVTIKGNQGLLKSENLSSFLFPLLGQYLCKYSTYLYTLCLQGTLANGTTVAVKKLSSKSSQGNREFLNEIGIISALRHPNLVRLFGCCIDGDQLLLIYEFLENNSLGRALFGKFS